MWRPVPWIGFVYFGAVELIFIIAARLPLLDVLSELFAPLVYYVVFPIGVAWLVMFVELDGRSPHLWAISYLRFLIRPHITRAGAPVQDSADYGGRMRIWWDLAAPRLHHGWVRGGIVTTTISGRFTHALLRHCQPVLCGDDDREPVVGYEVEDRLEIRP